MSNLIYESVDPISTEDLVQMFKSKDPEIVARALYAGTKWEENWEWIADQCLKFLSSPARSVRWAAATCLGDLAFLRRPLNVKVVIPALEAATRDPEIAGPADFSLSLVKEFLGF